MALTRHGLALVILLVFAPACGAGNPGVPSPPGATNTHTTAHFRITYADQDPSAVATRAVFGLSTEEFLDQWFAWAQARG